MQEIQAPFNIAVVAVTVIISYLGLTREGFAEKYLLDAQHILRDKQYYRIITSAVLHGSWTHLIFNMFSLYSFGSEVEFYFGPFQFIFIYLASILGGNLLSLALHRNHEYRALGASGGVCGIIFACIFLLPGSSVYIFFIPFPIPAYIFAIAFIAYSYFGLRHQADNIGHDAHLGGAIIGLAVTTAMHPHIINDNPILYPVVMGFAAVLFLSLYLYPLYMKHNSFEEIKDTVKNLKNHTQPDDENDEEILNRLLDKVSEHGIQSLTYIERQHLERISKRRQKN